MCNSRYHFIVPSEATVEDTRQLTAVVEGKYLGRLPLSHKWSPPAPGEGGEDDYGPYNAAASVFESHDHLLHGVLHANGYGHLLRMNGSQGGSRKLIGALLGLQERRAGWWPGGCCSWRHGNCRDTVGWRNNVLSAQGRCLSEAATPRRVRLQLLNEAVAATTAG